MKKPFLFVGVFSTLVCFAVQAALGADVLTEPVQPALIEGTWRWNFAMPDGTTSRPKLLLDWRDGKLSGISSFRSGTDAPITNAVLIGNEVRFQVVRARNGQEVVTTYTGKWSGKTIQGKIESNWAGEKQSYSWEAERTKAGADGIWKWTQAGAERKIEFKQDGERLTGATPGRTEFRLVIRNGAVRNGMVSFDIESTRGVTHYSGKRTGDVIKGFLETVTTTRRRAEWEARRED